MIAPRMPTMILADKSDLPGEPSGNRADHEHDDNCNRIHRISLSRGESDKTVLLVTIAAVVVIVLGIILG